MSPIKFSNFSRLANKTRPTDRDSFLVDKLNAEVNNSANTRTKTRAALWRGGQCLDGGCFGGIDQLANTAIVQKLNVVVVNTEVLERLLRGMLLQVSWHLAVLHRHMLPRSRRKSMSELLGLAKITRHRPIFVRHGGPNRGGHFDAYAVEQNATIESPVILSALAAWYSKFAMEPDWIQAYRRRRVVCWRHP
eukprot:1797205-Pleurochrysis_carterae.AAC.3